MLVNYTLAIGLISALLAIAAGIIAFVYSLPIQIGIIALVFGVITLIMEGSSYGMRAFSYSAFRSVWYLIAGILYIVFGLMTGNPVYGLLIAAGVLALVNAVIYGFSLTRNGELYEVRY